MTDEKQEAPGLRVAWQRNRWRLMMAVDLFAVLVGVWYFVTGNYSAATSVWVFLILMTLRSEPVVRARIGASVAVAPIEQPSEAETSRQPGQYL